MRNKAKHITEGAMIAVLYVILTYISMLFGLDKGIIQCRLSEVLAVLPAIFPSAVPGLFVGCIIANLLTGCAIWDIIFGSLATLAAALLTKALAKKPFLASLPPIALNTLVVPLVLAYVYHANEALPLLLVSVFVGESISCGALGTALLVFLTKRQSFHR